jgi:tRNA-dihydrouridine synthase B
MGLILTNFHNGLILAPMAGITDLAFRETIRGISPNVLMFSEMVSAKAMSYNDKNTFELLKTTKLDKPSLSIQLFGHEPEIIAESAKKIETLGYSYIDINCGCPAPKIVKNGDGSALLKNPRLIYEIVSQTKKAVKIPLSVKLRTGYDSHSVNVVECALLAEAAGADFLTVHGRTRDMQYSGKAGLNYIKAVKDAIKIPVIGNGDVTSLESYKNMLEKTGCDGVMLGRAALSNPFIFENIKNPNKIFTKSDKMNTLKTLIYKMCEYNKNPVKEARARILWYLKGYKNAKFYKEKAAKVMNLADTLNLIEDIAADNNVY